MPPRQLSKQPGNSYNIVNGLGCFDCKYKVVKFPSSSINLFQPKEGPRGQKPSLCKKELSASEREWGEEGQRQEALGAPTDLPAMFISPPPTDERSVKLQEHQPSGPSSVSLTTISPWCGLGCLGCSTCQQPLPHPSDSV